MPEITLAELSIYLSITGAALGACWMIIKQGMRHVLEKIDQHQNADNGRLEPLCASIRDLLDAQQALADRVAMLETHRLALPSRDEVHRLALTVEKLDGRMNRFDALIERIDRIVERQEQYLINRSH